MGEMPTKYRILLVDDEVGKDKLEVIVGGLKSLDFYVKGVDTAEKALQELEDADVAGEPFHAAILDLHLKSSGFEYRYNKWALPKEVGERWPDIARIVISGVFVDDVNQVQALEKYGEEFIKKDWLSGGSGFEVLAQRIRTVIRLMNAPPGPGRAIYKFRHKDAPENMVFPTCELRGWFAFDLVNRTLSSPKGEDLELTSSEDWALEAMILLTGIEDDRRLVRYEDFMTYQSRNRRISRPHVFAGQELRVHVHRTISGLRTKIVGPKSKRKKRDDLFRSKTGEGYYFDATIQAQEAP